MKILVTLIMGCSPLTLSAAGGWTPKQSTAFNMDCGKGVDKKGVPPSEEDLAKTICQCVGEKLSQVYTYETYKKAETFTRPVRKSMREKIATFTRECSCQYARPGSKLAQQCPPSP
jgi:hypothetical protein